MPRRPGAPKLHLNEHLSDRLAIQLGRHGYDVTSSEGAGLLREPDDRQLAFAVSQQRAILTFNHGDFSRLNTEYLSAGRLHWGIILSTQVPISVLFRRLLVLLHTLSAEELKNQVRWLNEFETIAAL